MMLLWCCHVRMVKDVVDGVVCDMEGIIGYRVLV